jgi:hypothetical protein
MIAVCGKIYLFGGGVWSSKRGWTEQFNETWLYNPGTHADTLLQCMCVARARTDHSVAWRGGEQRTTSGQK